MQTMTLDEKLENFYKSAIDSATSQSIEIVKEYQDTLKRIYEERKEEATKKAQNRYRTESDLMLREKNKRLSQETLNIKRRVLDKIAELTDSIFNVVATELMAFIQTSEYMDLLCKQIISAKEFARNDSIKIYINATDEYLKASLEERTGVTLDISDRDFIGGIRAVIPARSVLIDHSFLTKMDEEKKSFTLL